MKTNLKETSQRLRSLVDLIDKNEDAKLKLQTWVGEYDGKIVEFRTRDSAFHAVLTRENIRLEEGSYPSPDVIIMAEPDFLMNVLSEKIKISSSLLVEGELSIWGNFHDLIAFTKILSSLKNTTEK